MPARATFSKEAKGMSRLNARSTVVPSSAWSVTVSAAICGAATKMATASSTDTMSTGRSAAER